MEPLPFDALTLRKKLVKDKLPRIIVGEKFSITMYTKLPLFIVGSPNMVDREVQSFYFVFYDNLEKVRAPIWISIKFVFATAANFMRAVENFSQNLTSSPLARSNQTLQANLSGFITWDFMLIPYTCSRLEKYWLMYLYCIKSWASCICGTFLKDWKP